MVLFNIVLVLLVNILFCLFVEDMVCVEELECEEVLEIKVFLFFVFEVIFFLVCLGVGGLDIEYIKFLLLLFCIEYELLFRE